MVRGICASTVLGVAAVSVLAAANPQVPVFHGAARTVPMYATVRDSSGRIATGLGRDDFELLDNGRPAPLVEFSSEPQPFTSALLLDLNWATERDFLLMREGASAFVDALLPADRLRIGTFGAEFGLSPLLTGDKSTLARILREEMWPEESHSQSPFFGAIDLAMTSLTSGSGRRVIVVISGERFMDRHYEGGPCGPGCVMGKGPAADQDQSGRVHNRAVREDFVVYTVGVPGAGELPYEVADLSLKTGGASVTIAQATDLRGTLTRLAEELRTQYVLGFVPAVLDGKEHRLELRVRRPGHTVRARRSYVALKDAVPVAASAAREGAPASAAATGAGIAATPPSPKYSSPMRLAVAVADSHGSPVPDASVADFTVMRGGAAVEVTSIASVARESISLVVLADVSLSMQTGSRWPAERLRLQQKRVVARGWTEPGLALTVRHIRDVVERTVRGLKATDRVRVGTIARTLFLSAPFAGGARTLPAPVRRALDVRGHQTPEPLLESHPTSSPLRGPSPIWDAVDAAVDALSGEPGVRVIVLLTDGHSTGNQVGLEEVGWRAAQVGVPIHVIAARDAPYDVPQAGGGVGRVDARAGLVWLADVTGGSFGSMADRIDTEAETRRVIDAVRRTYVLTLSSVGPVAVGDLKVGITRAGLTVRAAQVFQKVPR